ncbi:MAG: zinc-binding dehydrogenase [Dehalococcoidia bacterium]|nr:zinc-binding dehydrogenase [Dehalococcoidia bacterium]
MLACIKTANGKVEMMDLPVPEPAEGEIVIKMSMATVCGTDMHFLDEFPNELVEFTYPGNLKPEGLPMGHEAVGIVHAVGTGVTRFQPGDRVISSCLVGCGKCHECMTVDHSMCTGSGGRVGRVLFGCQAEYYRVPFAEVNVAMVPDGVSDEHAVLATDILSTGFGAIDRAEAGFGDSVAVFAQGPLGLCATAGARARGCGLIIGVDSVPERLEMSKKLGANVVINHTEKDAVAEIMALTNNQGVDVAVEAVGTQATFESCTKVVRRGGTVSSIGVYGLLPQISIPTAVPSFLYRNIITTLCPSGHDRMEHLLALLQNGSVDLTALFTHRMKLADTAKAFDLFRSKTEGVLKIAITP